ncbi:MAG: hypothetical protein HUU35_13950, partial [Armatimonadetes bacterium]|nr:hypothetical protein [Armatimonadota bacterium]
MIPDGMGDVLARIDQIQGLLDRLNPEVAPSSQVPTSPGDFQNTLAAMLQPAAPEQLTARGVDGALPFAAG